MFGQILSRARVVVELFAMLVARVSPVDLVRSASIYQRAIVNYIGRSAFRIAFRSVHG